jgi:hypothetical protein
MDEEGRAMTQSRDAKSPISDRLDMTGRDGAVDYATKASAMESAFDHDRFAHVLGYALIEAWSDLPQPIQERLFERAVVLGHQTERDEMLREQLAKFLHDHHSRTAR